MNRFLLIYFFCALLTGQAAAQQNFVPGTIITISGDTISGYIDDRDWYKHTNIISFKDKISDSPRSLNTDEILRFTVVDGVYVSAEVKSEISSRNISTLEENGKLNLYTQS